MRLWSEMVVPLSNQSVGYVLFKVSSSLHQIKDVTDYISNSELTVK